MKNKLGGGVLFYGHTGSIPVQIAVVERLINGLAGLGIPDPRGVIVGSNADLSRF